VTRSRQNHIPNTNRMGIDRAFYVHIDSDEGSDLQSVSGVAQPRR
jgi:hypothetical protein